MCLISALSFLILLSGAASALAAGTLTITCLDVGQGDATLIESPSGMTLLFDGGDNHEGDDVVIPFLQSRGITSLDYTVASHYHADHISGLEEVLNTIPVTGAVYDRGWSYTTTTYYNYVAAAGAQRTTLTAGQVIDLGDGVTVTCIALNAAGTRSSPFSNSSYENDYDVALVVSYGGFDYFQAGDLTSIVETAIATQAGDMDVYQVNHHASTTSSNATFLQAIQAEVAVVSVGSNSYGHPAQSVLDRLVQYGSFVYQTENGSGGTLPAADLTVVGGHVVIQTDGGSTYTVDGDVWQTDEDVVAPAEDLMPVALQVLGNVPNPFNPMTQIRFTSAQDGPGRLDVYDLTGRRIWGRNLDVQSGDNAVVWNGKDAHGRAAAGGAYLYVVETAYGRDAGRMVLLK